MYQGKAREVSARGVEADNAADWITNVTATHLSHVMVSLCCSPAVLWVCLLLCRWVTTLSRPASAAAAAAAAAVGSKADGHTVGGTAAVRGSAGDACLRQTTLRFV